MMKNVLRTHLLLIFLGNSLVCAWAQAQESEFRRETIFDRIIYVENLLFDVPRVPRADQKMNLFRRRVSIGEVKLYVAEEGKGMPVVLLNGGPGNSHHSFLPYFTRAAAFARTIYYDQRGTGLSGYNAGANGFSFVQAVDDLERLRQKLGIDKWIVLGHSYGGTLAQAYAVKYGEHVAGLVLVGSLVPFPVDVGSREYDFISQVEFTRIRQIYSINGNAVVPAHNDQVNATMLQRMIFNGFLNGDWKRQQFYRPTMERMAQVALYEWVHAKNFNRIVGRQAAQLNLQGAFEKCPIPTLILEGKWDIVFGKDKPALLHAQHPRSKLIVFDQSSHFPFRDEPERFFQFLNEFISTLANISREELISWRTSISPQRARLTSHSR